MLPKQTHCHAAGTCYRFAPDGAMSASFPGIRYLCPEHLKIFESYGVANYLTGRPDRGLVCLCQRRLIVAEDWASQSEYLMEIARDVGQFVCDELDRKVTHWTTDCCRYPVFTLERSDGSYVIVNMQKAQETLFAVAFGDAPATRTDPGLHIELPGGWTPLHSIALILFGASAIDGHVAQVELEEIVNKLMEYPPLDAERAKQVLGVAYTFAKRLMAEGGLGGLLQGVSVHGALLEQGYSEPTLRAILSDVAHVIGADGVLDPKEHEYFIALTHQFGLG